MTWLDAMLSHAIVDDGDWMVVTDKEIGAWNKGAVKTLDELQQESSKFQDVAGDDGFFMNGDRVVNERITIIPGGTWAHQSFFGQAN